MSVTTKNIILFSLTILGFVFCGIAIATNRGINHTEMDLFGWISLGCFVAAFLWLFIKNVL